MPLGLLKVANRNEAQLSRSGNSLRHLLLWSRKRTTESNEILRETLIL